MSPVVTEERTVTAPLNTAPIRTVASVAAERERVKQYLRLGREHQQGRVNWITSIFMGLFHVGAIAALFFWSWRNVIAFAVMYFLAINVGIGMCYHRLLTHRGYRVPRWLEIALTVCGTLALEGGPIFWVATHRVHHQHSDQDGDPHTPNEGTWWAHAGWILSGRALHSETALLGRYAPDLTRDPAVEQIPLAAADRRWLSPDGHRVRSGRCQRRARHGAVGNVPPRRRRSPRHVAGQLRNAPLRQPPLPDQG